MASIKLLLICFCMVAITLAALSPEDDTFLEDLEQKAFLFFWEQSSTVTGLSLDRARTNGVTHMTVASIASTGFALAGYCIAADRRWMPRADLLERTKITLDFFASKAFHKEGWFWHFMEMDTGERRWETEISTIDTALLLGGVLTVRQCFKDDAEIVRRATLVYERVDFKYMLNGHASWMSHGWKPDIPGGFLTSRWTDYSEQAMLSLLAITSPRHSIPWTSWFTLKRQYTLYENYTYMSAVPPLFIHQYSHAFFDFRGLREHFKDFSVNYFQNSVDATMAHRQFFIDVLSKEFPTYNKDIWGMSASDSANGYKAWGAPPRDPDTDGSVVPCAAAGSLMFAPEVTLSALKAMKYRYPNTYGRYGFVDAFNPNTSWINPDVIGIDVGITLLSAENARTGNIWKWFMANPEAKRALELVHLVKEK